MNYEYHITEKSCGCTRRITFIDEGLAPLTTHVTHCDDHQRKIERYEQKLKDIKDLFTPQ